MKKSKLFLTVLGVLGATIGLTACDKCVDDGKCCPGDDGYPNCSSYEKIPEGIRGSEEGLHYTDTYRSLVGANIGTANYTGAGAATRIDGSDLNHVANFVDGLLTNDEYGRLVKNLATSVNQENNYQKFTFKIKQNVPWVDHNGIQAYGADENNVTGPLVVTAYDFVTTARLILDSTYGSSYNFLVAMFIEGAAEYAAITYVDSLTGPSAPKTDEARATLVDRYMKENFNIVRLNPMDASRISYIRNFDNVGIRVGVDSNNEKDKYKLEIILTESAPFFPTLLTYAPFMPIKESFIRKVGVAGEAGFGTDREKLLYCGPYYWASSPSTQIIYKRNELFHGNFKGDDVKLGKDESLRYLDGPTQAHIKEVIYTIAPQSIDHNYTRLQFEQGKIDGFSISSKDVDGWKKYVAGPDADGNTGTLQYDPEDITNYPGPVDGRVNSREYDTIDYTWHMTININRTNAVEGGTSAADQRSVFATAYDGDAGLVNTNRALKIKEVRELFVKAYDFQTHNKRFGNEMIEQTQHQLNTYVPPNFAKDDQGRDYIDSYYKEYGKNKFPELSEADATKAAKEKLKPGQYANIQSTETELAGYRERANKAIDLYNAGKAAADQIKRPVVLEAIAGIGSDTNSKLDEMELTASINRRMNGISQSNPNYYAPGYNDCDTIFMVNNESINDYNTFSTMVNAGHGHLVTWGWAPDYGDPLSYLGSHQTNGELAFATGTATELEGYYLNAAGTELLTVESILGRYDNLVLEGKNTHDNYVDRYAYFAEAEYELLNNVYTILPLYNNGQGWNASLSKGFGYDSPNSSYGLARNRLVGMWILPEVIDRATRYRVYDKYESDKATAQQTAAIYYFYDNPEYNR